jgi:hypothetical protein
MRMRNLLEGPNSGREPSKIPMVLPNIPVWQKRAKNVRVKKGAEKRVCALGAATLISTSI